MQLKYIYFCLKDYTKSKFPVKALLTFNFTSICTVAKKEIKKKIYILFYKDGMGFLCIEILTLNQMPS